MQSLNPDRMLIDSAGQLVIDPWTTSPAGEGGLDPRLPQFFFPCPLIVRDSGYVIASVVCAYGRVANAVYHDI